MSMGVWSENAEIDDIAQIRQAVARARAANAEKDKSDALASLQALADEVLPKRTKRRGRPKGASIASSAKYPYRDNTAKRNYKVVFWDEEIRHLEYSPVTRYKSGQMIRGVDIWEVLSQSESFETIDPLDLICLKETIREKWDNLPEQYQEALIRQFSR